MGVIHTYKNKVFNLKKDIVSKDSQVGIQKFREHLMALAGVKFNEPANPAVPNPKKTSSSTLETSAELKHALADQQVPVEASSKDLSNNTQIVMEEISADDADNSTHIQEQTVEQEVIIPAEILNSSADTQPEISPAPSNDTQTVVKEVSADDVDNNTHTQEQTVEQEIIISAEIPSFSADTQPEISSDPSNDTQAVMEEASADDVDNSTHTQEQTVEQEVIIPAEIPSFSENQPQRKASRSKPLPKVTTPVRKTPSKRRRRLKNPAETRVPLDVLTPEKPKVIANTPQPSKPSSRNVTPSPAKLTRREQEKAIQERAAVRSSRTSEQMVEVFKNSIAELEAKMNSVHTSDKNKKIIAIQIKNLRERMTAEEKRIARG